MFEARTVPEVRLISIVAAPRGERHPQTIPRHAFDFRRRRGRSGHKVEDHNVHMLH